MLKLVSQIQIQNFNSVQQMFVKHTLCANNHQLQQKAESNFI